MNEVTCWIFERISSRMLELYEGKLSRTVLRGVGDGNVICLPDRRRLTKVGQIPVSDAQDDNDIKDQMIKVA